MMGLVKSEFMKLRTTNVWWGVLIGVVAWTALSLLFNIAAVVNPGLSGDVGETDTTGLSEQQAEQIANQQALQASPDFLASTVYNAGQFVGLLMALILGILIVTNEFFHMTATPTFLVTPKRTKVIVAKLGAAVTWGFALGLVATVMSIVVGVIYFGVKGVDAHLADADVIASIVLKLLAFAIWAIFGLGLGTLVKNQVVAIIIALGAYLVGQTAIQVALFFISDWLNATWINDISYYMPAGASAVMTSAEKLSPTAPEWWGGALVLLAYGVVAAVIGTLITRKRDIT